MAVRSIFRAPNRDAALRYAGAFGTAGLAMHVTGGEGSCVAHVWFPTLFGDVSRPSVARGAEAVAAVLYDTLKAGERDVFLHCEPACAGAVSAALASRNLAVSDRPGQEERPAGVTTAWSVAPLPDIPFECGDVVSLTPERAGGTTVLRWRDEGGCDAGVHLVVSRELTPQEAALARSGTGRVKSFAFGSMPANGGFTPTQLLVLEIPPELARAFPDGTLPRHGGLP